MPKPKPGETSLRDKIIERMFDALPATTMDEIAQRVRPKMSGYRIPTSYFHRALAHLRKNPEKYGWTVPHVGGDSTQENRYFAMLVERDGSYHFDQSPSSMAHLHDGSKSIVSRIATESANQAS